MGHWPVFTQYDRIPSINKLKRGKMYCISNIEIVVYRPCSVAPRAVVKQNIMELGTGGKAAHLMVTGSRESHMLAVTHFLQLDPQLRMSLSPLVAPAAGNQASST